MRRLRVGDFAVRQQGDAQIHVDAQRLGAYIDGDGGSALSGQRETLIVRSHVKSLLLAAEQIAEERLRPVEPADHPPTHEHGRAEKAVGLG